MSADFYTALTALWPIFAAICAVVFCGLAWALRHEGKIRELGRDLNRLSDDHQQLRGEHNTLNNKTLEQISLMREQLARIETALMYKTRRSTN